MPNGVGDAVRPELAPDDERLLHVVELGVTSYDDVLAMQREAARARIAGELSQDLLVAVQHQAVVTLGRAFKSSHLLVTPEYLHERGIELREVERGGDVTIHEPGQLVIYPIVDLKRHRRDLHWYLRQLEDVIIGALAHSHIDATRQPGQTGVWREGRKLASIGVHARDWVTWHGVALNVCNDLATFAHVVPCGIDQLTMTTVAREAALLSLPVPTMSDVRQAVVSTFGVAFNVEPVPAPAAVLERIGAIAMLA